jgi:hypothetical protein
MRPSATARNNAPVLTPSPALWADFVAKRFWVFEEATLIQDQPATSKVDSKICSF